MAALAGAAGVGLNGAKWLQNYIEKTALKGATTTVLEKPGNSEMAAEAVKLRPFELAKMVRAL